MSTPSDLLKSDCSQCASLCCVSLHIEMSNKFAIDKPAGLPCPNLCSNGDCKIHSDLTSSGFEGCVDYDCHGAGQRVVQDLFNGKSWQQAPELLEKMSEDFTKMRRLYKWLGLLVTAHDLALPPALSQECASLIELLTPPHGWTRTDFDAFDEPMVKIRITAFLFQLKDII